MANELLRFRTRLQHVRHWSMILFDSFNILGIYKRRLEVSALFESSDGGFFGSRSCEGQTKIAT